MKRKFPIAISVALILAITITTMAFADVSPAPIIFTTNVPCPVNVVNVVVSSYTDPTNNSGGTISNSISSSESWTLYTYPSTPVAFIYPTFVVCGTTTYNFVSLSPTSPITSGAGSSEPITVLGYYAVPVFNTAPTITVNDVTREGNTIGGLILAFADIGSASDLEDTTPSVICTPAIGSVLPLGPNSVSCTATDSGGLTATDSGTVTVVDTTKPTIADNPDMTVEGNTTGGANVSFSNPAASDVVDANVDVNCTPPSGSLFALGGPYTITCMATDDSGNSSSSSFDVTVIDTTGPSLLLPANITKTAANADGAVVTYSASANDIVDSSPVVTCNPASGSTFPIGVTTVGCTAMDHSGNSTSGSFTITVQYASAGVKCGGIPGHQILSPIDLDGSRVFKLGSVVPARFRVCGADGVPIATSNLIQSFKLVQVISQGTVSDVDQPVLAITPTILFHSANQQWLFNISTKLLSAGKTYVYLITLNDGSTIQFQFSLK